MNGASLPVVMVDCGSARADALGELLQAVGASLRQVALSEANATRFLDCDAVVISGGPQLFTAPGGDSLLEQFDFIKRLERPALGICLGHQAMGLAAGARVFRGAERRGTELVRRIGEHGLLDGLPDTVPLTADHCEGIDVPAGYICLASSPHYRNEIMVQPERGFVGVQAHPESSGAAGRRLIENFMQLVRARSA
ncbi:MAG: hypothetical protein HKO62_10200 [Gammaproteobacteria bacterium]|nr:hypothetical protein [Gammaproteobacteria bacterium]NNM01110.1 hypothetical protein [Gammaproteobacteria bacterium]